jgi:hypothetical protein
MADAEDLKSRQGTWHRDAPKRSTAKIAFVWLAFRDSFRAAPRTTAKQNEKPTDTTVAPLFYAKQVAPECGKVETYLVPPDAAPPRRDSTAFVEINFVARFRSHDTDEHATRVLVCS